VETQIGPIGAISPLTQQSEGPLKDMSQQDIIGQVSVSDIVRTEEATESF